MTESTCFSNMSVHTCQITWRHIPNRKHCLWSTRWKPRIWHTESVIYPSCYYMAFK